MVLMDITPFVERLRQELSAVADAGGADVRAAADRIGIALDPATRMMLLEALSEAAAEISTLVPSGSVDVRLRGREAEFVVDVPPPPSAGPTIPTSVPEPDAGDQAEDGDLVRITLRVPESVKVKAEELAAKSGRSLNAWIVGALRAATSERGLNFGIDLTTLTGYPWGLGPQDGPGRNDAGHRMSGWV